MDISKKMLQTTEVTGLGLNIRIPVLSGAITGYTFGTFTGYCSSYQFSSEISPVKLTSG